MSYIDQNLLPDEQILFRTKKHIIVFLMPVILTIFCVYFASYFYINPILTKLMWVPWAAALFFWLYVGIDYLTSEFVVTNKRVMMREGFFYRHTNEMRLTAISQVNVGQSLVGQLLNYGTVAIYAFGAFDAFPLISRPVMFQKYVNEQLDKVVR